MSRLEKFYPVLIALSVAGGFLLGEVHLVRESAGMLITPFLMAMLFFTFIQIPVTKIMQGFSHRTFLWASLVLNFLAIPLIAWGIAALMLADHPALWVGFIMLMVTPCTDWYINFTQMAKGNMALSTSILPLNLILQLILLPLYLLLFTGSTGFVNLSFLVESILLVLVLPFLFAWLVRKWMMKKERDISKWNSLSIVFLCLTIVVMFTSQGYLLLENVSLLTRLLAALLVIYTVNFLIARGVGRGLRFSKKELVSLHMTTLARNSPIALAIALTAFPNEPLIAIVLIVAPLIELPVLTLAAVILKFL